MCFCLFSPPGCRARGTSSSKTKNWRGWSNRTCWERPYHNHSLFLCFLYCFFCGRREKDLSVLFLLSSFPEIRYFQDEDVRTKLTDILFCYARENEQLLYKQVRVRCLNTWGILLNHADSYEGSHRICVGVQPVQSKEQNTSLIYPNHYQCLQQVPNK